MSRRNRDEPEQFAPYEDYLEGMIWPSIEPGGYVKESYVDTMAPQHCSSAIHKMKRWNEQQWARDIDVERHWMALQRSPLVRALQAKASGTEDFSTLFDASEGLNDKTAANLLAHVMFEGAGLDAPDPMVVAELATRAAKNLYKKGYVILHDQS